MRTASIATVLAALMALAACGNTTEQRAATGGLGGLVLLGGPVGAAMGAGAGVVAGGAMD